jgi:hypothetical protein
MHGEKREELLDVARIGSTFFAASRRSLPIWRRQRSTA